MKALKEALASVKTEDKGAEVEQQVMDFIHVNREDAYKFFFDLGETVSHEFTDADADRFMLEFDKGRKAGWARHLAGGHLK